MDVELSDLTLVERLEEVRRCPADVGRIVSVPHRCARVKQIRLCFAGSIRLKTFVIPQISSNPKVSKTSAGRCKDKVGAPIRKG